MNSSTGKRAPLPAVGWRPDQRRRGGWVKFVSDDGTQRHLFDLSSLPVAEPVIAQIASTFEAATGPSGTAKRLATAQNFHRVATELCRWIEAAHPGLTALERLGAADARVMARSFSRGRQLNLAQSLVRQSPHFTDEFKDEFFRHRLRRTDQPRQPYDADEMERLCVMARGLTRRARTRIWDSRALVAQFRDGSLESDEPDRGRHVLAEALDHCARHHDMPRTADGRPSMLSRRAVAVTGGTSLMSMLHPTAKEIWAFGVLLTAQTGRNRSVIDWLSTPHLPASGPGEPPVSLVETYKPRRGRRAHSTLPLSAYPPELSGGAEAVVSARQATSLNAPLGVYTLLVDLTQPGREVLGTDRAFVYYTREGGSPMDRFRVGLPNSDGRRSQWVQPWLVGDGNRLDHAVLEASFDRLRKTRLLLSRRPIDHTPATNASYLRNMRPATDDGFSIVRGTLQKEVNKALKRREMRTIPEPGNNDDSGLANDTVLANCSDFSHSPLDNDQACQRTFLKCLDCRNARAFPRHLPFQLLVIDHLHGLRTALTASEWATRHAGQLAQLEDVVAAFTPAQVRQARTATTDAHRAVVDQLLEGGFDPA